MALDYFKRIDSPIAAIATATGGPIAVIRVSGKSLAELCRDFQITEDHRAYYREIFGIDHGLVIFFKAPKSFTGEDVIEFQVHGSDRTCETILIELKKRNFIEALPGEFSFRAFKNGKMTLAEVEALHVALTVASDTDRAREFLSLSQETQASTVSVFFNLESKLTSARGRLESAIDFSEAVEEQKDDVASTEKKLEELSGALDEFLTNYENFSAATSTPRILIVGEPNSGKSSLLNLLVGGERSLVSDTPGTTRDYIEAKVKIKNQNFIFIDTAGLRELEGASVEKRGIDRAVSMIKNARGIIWVSSSEKSPNQRIEKLVSSHKCVVRIESFGDKTGRTSAINLLTESPKLRSVLEAELLPKVFDDSEPVNFFISARQAVLLTEVSERVRTSIQNLKEDRPLEVIAEDLRLADVALKKCVGREISNDYISEIFSQFCLGK